MVVINLVDIFIAKNIDLNRLTKSKQNNKNNNTYKSIKATTLPSSIGSIFFP